MVGKRQVSLDLYLDGMLGRKKRCRGVMSWGMQLNRLPEHMLCFIFSLLHPLYLYQCALVCRGWKNLIMNEVDLKGLWAKQEPWLLVNRYSEKRYEIWCPLSGVRFPFPASLIPDKIQDLGRLIQAGTYQGLTLSQSRHGLFAWAPLSGSSQLIPYPFSPCPVRYRCFASDIWADVEQGVFKIGHHCPTGVHVYDSSARSWVFEETPREIRELGKLVSIPSLNLNSAFPPPTSYVKQYASDCKQDTGKWKKWVKTPESDLERWYTVFRDGKGRCNGVTFAPHYTILLWRLSEDLCTWVQIGETSLYKDVDLCVWKQPPLYQIACSENLIVIGLGSYNSPYPSRILTFNLDTLRWDMLYSEVDEKDVPVYVMAIFQPNLLSHNEKFELWI